MRKITYIYALIDPRNKQVKYIGKANNVLKRYKEHMRDCNLKDSTKKNAWIKKLKKLNLKPILKVLFQAPIKNWEIFEKHFIKYYGVENLTNLTKGGDGGSGWKKGKKRDKQFVEKIKNNHWTKRPDVEEIKKKISKKLEVSMKGNCNTKGKHFKHKSNKNYYKKI